jgi:signal transduction histidine kinase
VQELGGRVLVDTSPGTGTRMRVLLPLFRPQALPSADAQRDVA